MSVLSRKNKVVQMSLKSFISRYPGYLWLFRSWGLDLDDPDYIVRVDLRSGAFEVGYPSDTWRLTC